MAVTTKRRSRTHDKAPGIGVDAQGGAVIDPTSNVLDLVEAAVQRQDDLRDAARDFVNAALKNQAKVAKLRAKYARDFGILKSDHMRELREAEGNRLNAIRMVDVQQRDTQAAQAADQIKALAANVTTVAETLRTSASQTASNLAEQAAASNEAINRRLVALEQASYEGRGKEKFADPAMAGIVDEMKRMAVALSEARIRESATDPALVTALSDIKTLLIGQATKTGESAGSKNMWGYVVAGFGFLLLMQQLLPYFNK